MQITREDTGHLSARLRITVEEKDYSEKVEKQLKDYRRKAKVPGFRPGMAPAGMIRRTYGKSFLVEEVNTLLSESIADYLRDQELNILGHPLAVSEGAPELDWDNPKDFEFWFDLGLAPEVKADLENLSPVDYYDIQADDEQVDRYVTDLQRRFGNRVNPEESAAGDILKGMFIELNTDGEPRDEGISKESSLSLDFVKDEGIQAMLTGMKPGDSVVFNPLKATDHAGEVASMLDIPRERAETLEEDYRFTLTEITRVEPAAMDQDFFQKVFPTEEIADENAFREKVRSEISRSLSREAETHFFNDTLKVLMEEDRFDLPEDFLKRWLMHNSKREIGPEEVDQQFPAFLKSMRWQILHENLMEKYGIRVGTNDIRMHIQSYFQRQFGFPGADDGGLDASLAPIIDSVMKNEEEVEKIHDQIAEDRLISLFLEKVPQNRKTVAYEEFIRIVKEAANN